MTRRVVALFVLILSMFAGPGFAEEEETAKSLKEAIVKGKPILSFRYRYEDVKDDAVGDKHARASTL